MKRVYEKLISTGTAGSPVELANFVKLINQVSVFGVAVSFIMFVFLLINGSEDFTFNLIIIALFASFLWLNKFNFHNLALYLFVITIPAVLFFYAWQKAGDIENYFYIFPMISVFVFRNNRLLGWVLLVYSLLLLLVLKLDLMILSRESYIFEDFRILLNTAIPFVLIFFLTRFVNRNKEKEKEEIESISNTRGRLLSILSHDLRNPIRNLELLTTAAINERFTHEDYNRFMTMMSNQLKMTGLTLENTLLWVNKQTDGIEPDLKWFDLSIMVNENLMAMEHIISSKGLQIENSLDDNMLVHSDREIISIVMRNLLSNAIKHTFPTYGKIKIFAELEDNKLWIRVKDNGRGMDRSQVSSLFAGKKSVPGTQNEKGFGIGLSLVKGFLDKLDEQIAVESSYGNGSTFSYSVKRYKTSRLSA